ncbi:MAG: radical SAM protein [Deltaproteobacteria bacterium]|nr:MAG: radical SAM protein [Deltaproteobacteria bacterium]
MTAPARIPAHERLRISEIYASVQGESTHVGKPCVFVRLTGCNLRCSWCDSVFTFTGGEMRRIDDIVADAHAFGIHTIEVTGGEPLVQKNAPELMRRLVDLGHEVLLETSGSVSIAEVPPEVHVIMDLKAPASGEAERNLWSNLDLLQPHHEVKIVVASREDYEWAREVVRTRAVHERCPVMISPAWGLVDLAALAEWIVEDRLPVRMQLQLHKVVWGAEAQGV